LKGVETGFGHRSAGRSQSRNWVKKMQRSWMIHQRCFYYVFIVVVIRYETTAAAGWTLIFIVRAFINYTITVAIWTSFSFHLCLMWMLTIHDRPVPARLYRQVL
jgi:uncharacterized membrane protein